MLLPLSPEAPAGKARKRLSTAHGGAAGSGMQRWTNKNGHSDKDGSHPRRGLTEGEGREATTEPEQRAKSVVR